jgi:ribulose-phosphate 3-epimerase
VIKCLRKNVPVGIFDVHLMVSRPDQWIKDMADAGTDAFTFHLETTSDGVDIEETIQAVKSAGMKVGLALKPGTPVEAVFPFVEMLDQVLIMTVEPVRRCSGLSSEIDRLMMHCCIM